MGESISRRSFLVGAAGAVAAAGLAGCAPQPSGQAAAAGAESDLPEAWDKEALSSVRARAERLLPGGRSKAGCPS